MNPSKRTGLFSLLLLLWMLYPNAATASGPKIEISHMVMKNSKGTLLVDLKVDSEFSPEINEAVLNGVPVRFTFIISLDEVQDFWFDTRIASRTAIHELKYDVTKNTYKLTRSRGPLRPIYMDDFQNARLQFSEISNLEVIALKDLTRGEHYQLSVSAGLSIRKYAFFNLFQEVKNDRYTINFTH